MRFVKWASVVDVPIVERDGRAVLGLLAPGRGHAGRGHPGAGMAGRRLTCGLLDVPFTQRRYLHRLDSLSVQDGRVTASGSTVDYDGSLAEATAIELRYLIGGDRSALSVPAVWTGDGRHPAHVACRGPGRRTHCCGRCRRRIAAPWASPSWRGEHVNVTSARSPQSASVRDGAAPSRDARDGRAPTPWRCCRTTTVRWDGGPCAPDGCGEPAQRRCGNGGSACPGTTRLATIAALARRDVLVPALAWVGGRLPSRRLAVLEADGGRSFDGNVRAARRRPARERARTSRRRGSTARSPGACPRAPRPSSARACAPRGCSRAPRSSSSDGTAAPLTPPGPRARRRERRHRCPVPPPGPRRPERAGEPRCRRGRATSSPAVGAPARPVRRVGAHPDGRVRLLRAVDRASGCRGSTALRPIGGPTWPACAGASTCPTTGRSSCGHPSPRPVGCGGRPARPRRVGRGAGQARLPARPGPREGGRRGARRACARRVRDLAHEEDVLPFLAAADLVVSDYSPRRRRRRGSGRPGRAVPAGPGGVRQPHARACTRGPTRPGPSCRASPSLLDEVGAVARRSGGLGRGARPASAGVGGAGGRHRRRRVHPARPSTRSSPAWSDDDQAADRHHGQQHRRARWRPAGRPRRGAAARRARLSRRPRRRGPARAPARVRRRPGVPSLHADAGRVAGAAARRPAGHAGCARRSAGSSPGAPRCGRRPSTASPRSSPTDRPGSSSRRSCGRWSTSPRCRTTTGP